MIKIVAGPLFPISSRSPFIRSSFALALVIAVVSMFTSGCQPAAESEAQPPADPLTVAEDFEGEADPDRMTLEMHTWTWLETAYNNDTIKEPAEKEAFTLTFADGRVNGSTDCNRFSGAYTVDDNKIQFDEKMAMTKMYCEGSQETEFVKMLLEVRSYFFTSRGQLILEIKFDSGVMKFR